MDFQTHYKRNPAPPEINSGEKLVETAGYITAQQRIEAILNAGQRLVEFRKEQFDFSDDSEFDEDFEDPTRSKNFDLADGTNLVSLLEHKKRIADEEAIRKKYLKSSQTAQEPQNEALIDPERV